MKLTISNLDILNVFGHAVSRLKHFVGEAITKVQTPVGPMCS